MSFSKTCHFSIAVVQMMLNIRLFVPVLSLVIFFQCTAINIVTAQSLKGLHVLLYTRNGKGYVHDNIPYAVQAFRQMSATQEFRLTVSDTPIVFTDAALAGVDLLVFASTNNDVFETASQRLAFRRYMEAGGGFVGLHSVMGTERRWAWFKQMLGGSFSWHPKNQVLEVVNIKPGHPSMAGLPGIWKKQDECYFSKELYPGVEVLMAHDIRLLDPADSTQIKSHAGGFYPLYPAVWYHAFDGGHAWITTLGHDIFNYSDPLFLRHILQGMEFIAGLSRKKNSRNAYASDWDEPVRYQP